MNLNMGNVVSLFRDKRPTECHFHEVIQEDISMYLVLEFDVNKFNSWTDETIGSLSKGVDLIKKAMSEYAGRALEWTTLSATDPDEKFSQHIVSHNISFSNSTQCAQFVVNALHVFVDLYRKKGLDSEDIRAKTIRLVTKSTGFPDLAIYSRNHSVRTCYSSKHGEGKPRTLFPLINNEVKTNFSGQMMQRSMIACFDSSNLFELKYVDDPIQEWKEWLVKEKFQKRKKIWRRNTHGNDLVIYKTKSHRADATEMLKGFMTEYFKEWDHKVREISHSRVFITFNLTGKYCFIKKDEHKNSSGRTMTVTHSVGIARMRCIFNDKCKGRVKEIQLKLDHRKKVAEFYEMIAGELVGSKRSRAEDGVFGKDRKKKRRLE